MKKLIPTLAVLCLCGFSCAQKTVPRTDTQSVPTPKMPEPTVVFTGDLCTIPDRDGKPAPFDWRHDHYVDHGTFEFNESRTIKDDINGDGKLDEITLTIDERSDTGAAKSTLTVKTQGRTVQETDLHPISLDGFCRQQGFSLVKIQPADPEKQISIGVGGSDGFSVTRYYAFDGSAIVPIGQIAGGLNGDGTVSSPFVTDTLGTWIAGKTLAYKDHAFVDVPRAFYPRADYGIITALRAVPLLESPAAESSLAVTLKKGDVIKILGCTDPEARDVWCQIKRKDGKSGWLEVNSADNVLPMNLSAHEVFDGLPAFD